MSPISEKDALHLLKSRLPSDRARAAEWWLGHAEPQHLTLLTEAIANESVPSIKRLLGIASDRIRTRNSPTLPVDESESGATNEASQILESLSGLIRHETEPVIGWLRRSAAKDIGTGYDSSETFRNIDLLRRRLRGLEALAAAQRVPRRRRLSLSRMISDCRPAGLSTEVFKSPLDDDAIDSDPGLLSIIFSNALLNAHEAGSAVHGEGAIWVESGVSDRDFWVAISNRFNGDSFEFEQFAHSGASSKDSHKGLGLSAMKLAANRLGYELSLTASGGTAFFSVRGGRFHE